MSYKKLCLLTVISLCVLTSLCVYAALTNGIGRGETNNLTQETMAGTSPSSINEQQSTGIAEPSVTMGVPVLTQPVEIVPEQLPTAFDIVGAAIDAVKRAEIGERCLLIRKPKTLDDNVNLTLTLEDMAVDRSIYLSISGSIPCELTENDIIRIVGDEVFEGSSTAQDTKDPMMGLSMKWMDSSEETAEQGMLCMTVTLDRTYCYRVFEDETFFYIALLQPKSVYEKIVVIDAGHGGWDNGTSSADGRYLEKNVNLQIMLYLQELLEKDQEIQVYCTRTTDRWLTLEQRVELANALEADFFLSIHQNNASNNTTANGTEVLYAQQQNKWEGMNSKTFAKLCLANLLETVGLEDRGIVPRGHNVTILAEAMIPCALVEVGYMSNQEDLDIIVRDEVQRDIAACLYKSILQGYEKRVEE